MIKHLQDVKDPIVSKFRQKELDPILTENSYHPEESESDESNDKNRIVIRDLKWRSDTVSITFFCKVHTYIDLFLDLS